MTTPDTPMDCPKLLPNEIWKPVVGYDGVYEVSNMGRVRSIRYSKIMSPGFDKDGYERLFLRNSPQKTKTVFVHTLVAAAFIGERGNFIVNHKDSDKRNNKLENIEYVSKRENTNHGKKFQGIQKTGVKKTKWGYSSNIRIAGEKKYLGTFPTADQAAAAYIKEAEAINEGKYLKRLTAQKKPPHPRPNWTR